MSTTIYAADLDVRSRLEKLLTKHVAERAELLAAGAADHRVEALYPLDFERIVRSAGNRLAFRGTAHLSAAVIPKAEWNELGNILYLLLRDMGDMAESYKIEWKAHFGPAAAELEFYQQVHRALGYHHYLYETNDFTSRAGQALFMCYWLLRHPQFAVEQEANAQWLMNWVTGKLLP